MTAAVQYQAVAVRLAKAGEQLVRASVELHAIDPRWLPDVIALNREADAYLGLSLDFHALAYEAETERPREETAA